MRTKGPVINLRYQSAAQVAKFKKAAKACRWSLNTFLLVAADTYAAHVLSLPAEPPTSQPTSEYVQQQTTE